MTFTVGDRAQYRTDLLPGASPEWKGRTGTIIEIKGPIPGQGDFLFADIKMDDDDTIRPGIKTVVLVRVP
jgi:hypothetical protein